MATGTGSISVSGITAPVIGAFLYWHGPTNSTDPASNASVTFGGTPITGTNIGTASDNNWSFTNSQAYRADVTSLVTGNAAYSLSNFVKAGLPGCRHQRRLADRVLQRREFCERPERRALERQ